jgi:hypothetical protein
MMPISQQPKVEGWNRKKKKDKKHQQNPQSMKSNSQTNLMLIDKTEKYCILGKQPKKYLESIRVNPPNLQLMLWDYGYMVTL